MGKQGEHHDEERAHGQRLVEIRDGAPVIDDPHFNNGYEMKNRSQRKRSQRHAKQVFAPPDERKNGMQQPQRVQGSRHAQPDDAHFSHGFPDVSVLKHQYILRGSGHAPAQWGGAMDSVRGVPEAEATASSGVTQNGAASTAWCLLLGDRKSTCLNSSHLGISYAV